MGIPIQNHGFRLFSAFFLHLNHSPDKPETFRTAQPRWQNSEEVFVCKQFSVNKENNFNEGSEQKKTIRENGVCPAQELYRFIMSNSELQEEEREVLLSIYEGDPNFKDLSPTVYQYKYGIDNDPKSFLLEISWTKDYPSEKPKINMDTFYNKHIEADIKEKIMNVILEKAGQYLGEAMTYSLFEFVKEKEEELTKELPEKFILNSDVNSGDGSANTIKDQESIKSATKKAHLTKSQKRREWDKVTYKGEKPRGWDWVDLVKHLSQTGQKTIPQQDLTNNIIKN